MRAAVLRNANHEVPCAYPPNPFVRGDSPGLLAGAVVVLGLEQQVVLAVVVLGLVELCTARTTGRLTPTADTYGDSTLLATQHPATVPSSLTMLATARTIALALAGSLPTKPLCLHVSGFARPSGFA